MRYDFFFDSEPIEFFNFNTFYYVGEYWLDLDKIINDAIDIELRDIELKYGVTIKIDWWDYKENDF